MAIYSMRVSMIGRSQGRSATAAAAYRAGIAIDDERTGLRHDYTRKTGVAHTEIMTPRDTPEWMNNRAELWNAVEKVENRSNSQLAREIMLALPHELTDEQRKELVRGFVQEQCVSRGMVADVAIHRPSHHEAASEKNHHCHVLLTTREMIGGAWAKNKNRDWHDREMVEEWREAWASHQNRMFERLGIDERVDHRSYADRGILKEPTRHLGPIASEIERSGRKSHVGNDNREVEARNRSRRDLEEAGNVVDAKIAFEKRKFEHWAKTKRDKLNEETQAQRAARDIRITTAMQALNRQLDNEFGEEKSQLSDQHRDVSERLATGGWRKFIRDITLTTRGDKREQARIETDLARIEAAEAKKREAFEATQAARTANAEASFTKKKADLERGIQKAVKRREDTDWSPLPSDQMRYANEEKAPIDPEYNRAAKASQKPPHEDVEGKDPKQRELDRAAYVHQQKKTTLKRPERPPEPTYEQPPREKPDAPVSAKEDYIREQKAAKRYSEEKEKRDEYDKRFPRGK